MLTDTYKKLAFEMHTYFDGYSEEYLERSRQKLSFEKERLKLVKHPNHVETFDKFLIG